MQTYERSYWLKEGLTDQQLSAATANIQKCLASGDELLILHPIVRLRVQGEADAIERLVRAEVALERSDIMRVIENNEPLLSHKNRGAWVTRVRELGNPADYHMYDFD